MSFTAGALVITACAVLARAVTAELTDAEYYRLPPLFDLDDYERCLSQSDGLFCVGDFDLAPLSGRSDTYDKLKEHSDNLDHFNHTILYRGYCVSSRCPESRSEPNASWRFEQCVSRYSRPHDLRVALRPKHSCTSHSSRTLTAPLDVPSLLFLAVVALLLIANILGTLYDVYTTHKIKNPSLLAWSIRENWRRFTSFQKDKEFQAAQGVRVIFLLVVVFVHACIINMRFYMLNPHEVESWGNNGVLKTVRNATGFVQVFVVLSSFLLAYNILLDSEKKPITMSMYPSTLIKRFIRIGPVSMFMVAFAATWWPHTNNGPLWEQIVGAESAVCRRKFWWHMFYLQNVAKVEEHCLVQSWFLAADMQLYIVMLALTLALAQARLRRYALPVLLALYLAASAFIVYWSFKMHLIPVLHATTPEGLRTWMFSSTTFIHLYIPPWGSAPSAFLGLFLAYLYYEQRQTGFKPHDHAWLRWICGLSLPALLLWAASGNLVCLTTDPWYLALYAGVDRPIFAFLITISYYGLFNKIGINYWSVLSWRGWECAARASLAFMMLHWCVNMNLVAGKPYPIDGTIASCIIDTTITTVYTYLLAVPLTLMVEMPFTGTYNALRRN